MCNLGKTHLFLVKLVFYFAVVCKLHYIRLQKHSLLGQSHRQMSALEKFLADVASWYWWVSVVLLGLIINVASAYAKLPLDRFLEKRSIRRQQIRSAGDEKHAREIQTLLADSRLTVLQSAQEFRLMVMSVFFLILALAAGAFAVRVVNSGIIGVWLFAFSMVSAIIAMIAFTASTKMGNLLHAAEAKIREGKTAIEA